MPYIYAALMPAEQPNWPTLIADLTDRGLSQKDIAEKIGCDQSHISDLYTGRQANPRFSVGQALLKLLAETPARQAAA